MSSHTQPIEGFLKLHLILRLLPANPNAWSTPAPQR